MKTFSFNEDQLLSRSELSKVMAGSPPCGIGESFLEGSFHCGDGANGSVIAYYTCVPDDEFEESYETASIGPVFSNGESNPCII